MLSCLAYAFLSINKIKNCCENHNNLVIKDNQLHNMITSSFVKEDVMQRVKSIKFNLDKVDEKELYLYANRLENFAGTMKDLLKEKKRNENTNSHQNTVYSSNEEGVIKIQF
ncbi:hypothetical protein CJ195_16000 [Bacillus sp. UMB0899]|nr:hypothetical protein CJ195_16000 [Bacillus sp. UMB0899]